MRKFLRVCVCVSFVLDWVCFGSGLGETHARGLSHIARLPKDLPLRHDLMLIRFTSGFVFILLLYDSSMDTVQRTARTPSLFIAFLALFNKKTWLCPIRLYLTVTYPGCTGTPPVPHPDSTASLLFEEDLRTGHAQHVALLLYVKGFERVCNPREEHRWRRGCIVCVCVCVCVCEKE